MGRQIACLTFAGCFLLGGGCATTSRTDRPPTLILSPQSTDKNQCGPSTLTSVLQFHGHDADPKELRDSIYSPTAEGTLLTDLAFEARNRGFQTRIFSASPMDIADAVNSGIPPIVQLTFEVGGFRSSHITTVTGVHPDGYVVLDEKKPDDFLARTLFETAWTQSGNFLLLVTP